MVVLSALSSSSVLFLFATVLNNSDFVVYRHSSINEGFVCYNTENDSWPQQWIRLQPFILDDDGFSAFVTKQMPNSTKEENMIITYKLRFIYFNRSFVDSEWTHIFRNSTSNMLIDTTASGCNFSIILKLFLGLLFIKINIIVLVVYKNVINNKNDGL